VHGARLGCPAFQHLLHAALRALIDRLGSATFNVGVYNLGCAAGGAAAEGTPRNDFERATAARPPIVARYRPVSRISESHHPVPVPLPGPWAQQ
jgi:hypothetical protein